MARALCTGDCQSLWDQRCQELPPAAFRGSPDPDPDRLCAHCPGFVCGQCGERPASALHVPCRVCEPVTLLCENQARQRLNWRVAQLATATDQHGRAVNTRLNASIGVKTRKGISLSQLATALTLIEQWLEDPASMPTGRPAVSSTDLDQLHGADLRTLLTTYVGPLAKTLREPIPLVQQHLNDWMGAPRRAEATEEQLRDAIIQAEAWLPEPNSYYAYATPQAVEPGGLPAPIHTKQSPTDRSCSLCAAPVAAGELIGRIPRPRRPFVAMPWLCAHCLFDRRVKPRLTDVLLRVFHHVFSGSSAIPINTAEAQVLSEVLARVPAATAREHLLHAEIDTADPSILLSHDPALAVIDALWAAMPAMGAADAATLMAVAEHLAQRRHNPQGLNQQQLS